MSHPTEEEMSAFWEFVATKLGWTQKGASLFLNATGDLVTVRYRDGDRRFLAENLDSAKFLLAVDMTLPSLVKEAVMAPFDEALLRKGGRRHFNWQDIKDSPSARDMTAALK